MLVCICHYDKLYLLITETAHLKQQEYICIVAFICICLSEFCTYPVGHKGGQIL